MQAIILAAGMGRRLGEYTKDDTKCMVKVNGRRLIDRLMSQLIPLQLNRILIVTGYKGENLRKHIVSHYNGQVQIEFADNPIYDKTNNIYSLSLVKKQLQEDDTLLIESDLIFSDNLFKMILKDPHPNIALVAKYESWMDGTMVRIDADNNIVNFVPKKAFNYADIGQYYKTVNIYKFSRDFSLNIYVPFLNAYCSALGNNEYYEQVLRVITLLDHSNLKALPIGDEKWYEIDDVQDLDIAETIFAEDEEMIKRFNYRYGGHWRFPNMLDYCYLVNPYFPTPQLKAELKANFDALLTEYPSGMFVNSLLAGKYFGIKQDYSVVGNGAAELIKSLMELTDGNIGIIYPTFEEYPNRLPKDRIVAFCPNNPMLSYGVEDLKQFFIGKDIKSLLIINPDNPSGNFIPRTDLISMTEWCKQQDITIIVDESFIDFSDNFENNSLLRNDILEEFNNLVVIKSISKSYGVPGLRLGILASSRTTLIEKIRKDISIWNINSFAEFYMQIFNKYTADYKKACYRFISERARIQKQLEQIPFLRVIPSQANFFCCEVTQKYTSYELALRLLSDYNIMIKDCNSKTFLHGKNYIRLSVRNKEDNDKLIKALRALA